MEPNRERLQLLVNALVSGEYAQTRGYLRRTEQSLADDGDTAPVGYCCLGVGCELSQLGVWAVDMGSPSARYVTDDSAPGESRGFVTDKYEGSNSPYYFPRPVAAWFGIDGKDITFSWLGKDDGGFVRASSLNDLKLNFSQIADCIAYEFGLEIPAVVTA